LSGSLITEWTSRECNHYLVGGGDIAVLPVGSVEVLGPHLPVGARCFLAEAFSGLLAERVRGVRLPITPFSSAFTSFDRPGSVALSEQVVNDYVRAAMDDLLAGGFRRILLVTSLDYLRYYLPQEFYEDHNVAAAGIHLGELIHEFGREQQAGEDSAIVGALLLLDKRELAERVLAENRRLLQEEFTPAAVPQEVARLCRAGVIGFTCPPGGYQIPPNPKLSAEAGEEVLRRAAEAMAPWVESLRAYNEFLARRGVTRGLMWRGWRWSE